MKLNWPVKGVIFSTLLLMMPTVQSEDSRIQKITAGFVYNFAKFTVWPDLPVDAPIRICVNTELAVLQIYQQFAGKRIAAHQVEIVKYTEQALSSCQILFMDRSLPLPCIGRCLRQNLQVLSVSNTPDFVSSGGIIGLFEDQNQLRFRINLDAVYRSRLKLSSQLLKLARIWREAKQ